jgi:hypothetical protein
MRRYATFGLLLLAAAAALLVLWHPWMATKMELRVAEQPVKAPAGEPAANRAVTAPAETAVPAAPMTKAPADGGTFRGRVVDAVTRQPVREFEIQLVGMLRPGIPGNPRATQSFRSTDGRFAWQRAPVGTWTAVVVAPRYQRFRIEGLSIAANKTTRELLMPLRSGHTLQGRVFDQSSGAGIGNARVEFRDSGRPSNGLPQPGTSTKSNADGTFVLDGVPGGDMLVTAFAQNHASREIRVVAKDDTPPLEIGLMTGASVAGMVVASDGSPIVDGDVILHGPGAGEAVKLDASSGFRFANKPAGRYRLLASTPAGGASMEFELAESEIKEGVALKVGAGSSVRGVIRGVRPEQLKHTFISLRSESGGGNFFARPDEQGAYVMKGVSPGRTRLDVEVALSRRLRRVIDVRADRDTVLDIDFPPGVRLSGRVTQGAKPAADRTVSVQPSSDHPEISYFTGTTQDGTYEIEGVPPGEYRISVNADANRLVTIAGDTVVDFDIPRVQIGGRVVEEGGGAIPIVGAQVTVVGVQPQTAFVRYDDEADDFGRFQLTGIEPGEIVLSAYKPGYEMFREKIVYSSPITNRTITLRRGLVWRYACDPPQISRWAL